MRLPVAVPWARGSGAKVEAEVGWPLVVAVQGSVCVGGDGRRRGISRWRLGLGLQLPLDDGRALAVAHRDLVESRGFGVSKLPLVGGILHVLGDLLAQRDRVGALMLRQGGQLAIQDRQLVDLLDGVGIGGVEVGNQRQRAHQVRGEEFGIVEKVIDRRLGVWIGGGLGHLRRIVGFRHGASRGGRVDGGLRRTRQTLQPRVNQLVEETQREREGASRNLRGRAMGCWAAGGSLSQPWMQ